MRVGTSALRPISDLVTFISSGLGQDSEDIRQRLIHDEDFREKHAPGHVVIIAANTGDEHDHTLEHKDDVAADCAARGIEFHFMDNSLNKPSWPDLITALKKTSSIISRSGPKSCSDSLKVDPVYKFINQWIANKFYGGEGATKKVAMNRFHEEHGRIRVIIGIAKGEKGRILTRKERRALEKRDPWRRCIANKYPLVALGVDRAGAQADIASRGAKVPFPSNCVRCPYMSPQELVWAWRFERAKIEEWMEMERAKLEKNKGQPKNHGVFGDVHPIAVHLAAALEKFGHWSDEQLTEYKFSHGHCVASKY